MAPSDGTRAAPSRADDPGPRPHRPRAGRAIRRGLALWWDRIGLAAALNLAWMALVVIAGLIIDRVLGAGSLAPHGLPSHGLSVHAPPHHAAPLARPAVLAGNLVIILIAGALAAGPAAVIAKCFRYELAGFHDFIPGIRRDGARFAALTALGILWLGGCMVYFGWFIAAPTLRLLSPLFLYAAGFWMVAMPFQFALVTLENQSFGSALKKSMLLLLDNPLFSIATGMAGAAVAALLTVSRVGLGLAAVTAWLILGQASTLEVLRKYRPGIEDEEPPFAATDDAEQAVAS